MSLVRLAALLCVAASGAGIHAQESWTLRGLVTSAVSGRPLPGATVVVTGHQATGYPLHWSWMDWEDPAPITTGADGRFELVLPVQPGPGVGDGYPSRVHVSVTADAHVRHFGHVFLSRLYASPRLELDPIVLTAGRTVELRVVDTLGKPQPWEVVRLRSRTEIVEPRPWCDAVRVLQARGDANGRVRFASPIAFGTYFVEVLERATKTTTIEVGRDGRGEFTVQVAPAERSITSGRIVDAAGKGIEGLRLIAGPNLLQGPPPLLARTHDDGSFCFVGRDDTPVQCELWLDNELHHPNHRRRLAVIPMGGALDPIELGERDRVAFQIEGLPANAERVAFHLVPDKGGKATRAVVACRGGRIEVEGLVAGTYRVKVHALRVGTWPSEWVRCVLGASTQPIVVSLPQLHDQTVRVVDENGQPIAGVLVQGILSTHVLDQFEDPIESYRNDRWLRSPMSAYAMPPQIPDDGMPARLPCPATTGADGRATLRAPQHAEKFVVRLFGEHVVDTFLDFPGYPIAANTTELKVRAAGTVVVTGDAKELRLPRARLDEKIWRNTRECGPGPDPWARGLEPVLRQTGCGLWLRERGSTRYLRDELERFQPFLEHRLPVWTGVPPGIYELVLVVREAGDATTPFRSRVVGDPLATVEVRARAETKVAVVLNDEHLQSLR